MVAERGHPSPDMATATPPTQPLEVGCYVQGPPDRWRGLGLQPGKYPLPVPENKLGDDHS